MKITKKKLVEVKPNVVIELTYEEASLIMNYCFCSRAAADSVYGPVAAAAKLYIALDNLRYVKH